MRNKDRKEVTYTGKDGKTHLVYELKVRTKNNEYIKVSSLFPNAAFGVDSLGRETLTITLKEEKTLELKPGDTLILEVLTKKADTAVTSQQATKPIAAVPDAKKGNDQFTDWM